MKNRGNPFIANALEKNRIVYGSKTMTLDSTIIKILFLLSILIISFFITWIIGERYNINLWYICSISTIILFILAIITNLKPRLARITAAAYVIAEGTMLGAISKIMESNYPGVVISAVFLTISVLITTLIIYRDIGSLSEKLSRAVTIGIFSIGLIYLVSFLLRIFGVNLYILGSGVFGVVFSLIVIVLAVFSLMMDYQYIVRGAKYGSPKYMEWYYALGLMITLIWLYVEIVDLLEKLIDNIRE